MKNTISLRFLFVLFGAMAPLFCQAQTSFFTDTFSAGSTVNSSSPTAPTTTSTSYEVISSKGFNPTPSVSGHTLEFGIGNTSGGTVEAQALFTNNPVALTAIGDYITMVVVFNNVSGPLTAGQSYFGFGLYNSGGATTYPVPGGLNGTATTSTTANETGNAQLWQGYWAQVAYTSFVSAILTRPIQNSSPVSDVSQDLLTAGSGSESFQYPKGADVGPTISSSLVLNSNQVYTEVFTITLTNTDALAISNSLYLGSNTNGTPLATSTFGGVTSDSSSTYLTGGFNALGIGIYEKSTNNVYGNVMSISSISIFGQSTTVSTPPNITSQPTPALIATNGSGAFEIAANGFGVTYQWHRSNTNLVNGGNISGATSSILVISPASVSDEVNSYYCSVTGTGNYSTNSATNSLQLIVSTNLVYYENSEVWDVNDSNPNNENWAYSLPLSSGGPFTVFNDGDPVTFNDFGTGASLNITDPYTSPSSVTVANTNVNYTFSGSGSIAGPCTLAYIGSTINGAGQLIVTNANTYTGGTIISNAGADLILGNLDGLGTGPITVAKAGGEMEISVSGNASSGIPNDINVSNNFQIIFDASSNTYSGEFLGNFYGLSGAILTLTNGASYTGGLNRIRAYGENTVYNGGLNLASAGILFAPYCTAGSQTFNGVISGPGFLMQKGILTYLNGANTYSGGTYTPAGDIGLGSSYMASPASGPLGIGPILLAPDSTTSLTGTGEIFASVPNVTINNLIQYPSGTNNLTLEIGGVYNLTLSGAFTLNGNDGLATNTITSRIVQVTNTAVTTLSGVISDGGKGYGFNLTGSGVLALTRTENYSGPTLVSGGTLLVNGQIGTNIATVATSAVLGGSGTIGGAVTIQTGGSLAAGNQGIGTLTINSNLTFQTGSTNFVDVSQSSGNSKVTGLTGVAYSGVLVPNVVSGTLSSGQNFTIFSAGGSITGNFTSIAGSPGPGLSWSFTPATGVLSVTGSGVIVPTISPRVTGFSLSGNNVTVTATNGVNGGTYYLLGTTNLSAPVGQWLPVATNVVTASGSTQGFTFTGTNDYVTGAPGWFFMLSSTNN